MVTYMYGWLIIPQINNEYLTSKFIVLHVQVHIVHDHVTLWPCERFLHKTTDEIPVWEPYASVCASGAGKSRRALLQKHTALWVETLTKFLQIGHMIKYLFTKFWAGWKNIWLSAMVHGPCCARSVLHDLEPNIFPSGPPT